MRILPVYTLQKGHAMHYTIALFDLDGTLLESGTGVINAMHYALKTLNVSLPQGFDERRFIGPPLRYSLATFLRLPEPEVVEGLRLYREYYNERGYTEAAPYPGIMDMLAALQKAGMPACLATSKYYTLAERMTDHFGFRPYLQGVFASDGKEHSSAKKAIIQRALAAFPDAAKRPVMVGDTMYDAEGAREAKTSFIGVTFGYGTRQEMADEGAQTFVDDVATLTQMLLG